ncbi:hypothetical protein B4U84_11585 [Westiellopsis prolifica IICB1]|nr:hypothetical protein B4U84_11585 [Westiellopsis prolifica IICB1]
MNYLHCTEGHPILDFGLTSRPHGRVRGLELKILDAWILDYLPLPFPQIGGYGKGLFFSQSKISNLKLLGQLVNHIFTQFTVIVI